MSDPKAYSRWLSNCWTRISECQGCRPYGFNRAAFAFVIFTPGDAIEKGEAGYSQARPNVIFEIGWFYGRLGRERVCILFKKGTKIHSDIEGVSRIEFGNSVTEKIDEIEKELMGGHLLPPSP